MVRFGAWAAAGAVAAGSGCATVVSKGGGDQTVTVASSPPGAAVLVDGKPAGATPAEVKLSRHTEHTVEVAAPGYAPETVLVRRRFNPWVLGNIPIGLAGALVDVATDTTHRLSPDEVNVTLKPQPAAPAAGGGSEGSPVGVP